MIGAVSRFVTPLAATVFEAVQAACHAADAVIHSFLLTLAGHQVARERGVPGISAQLFPVFCGTAEFPGIVFPDLPLGNLYRRITHQVLNQAYWQTSRMLYRWVRRSHPHLPDLAGWPFDASRGRPSPILYAFSPQVIPRPTDWRDNVHVTGYWFRDDAGDWRPPQALVDFLEVGPRPVCVAFGSTVTKGREKLARTVLEALALSRQRGVVIGEGFPDQGASDGMFRLGSAPYSWLFPRASVVVHHGGAGTTGEALRAGVPSVVVPFTSDQPFWGRRVHDLGVGPQPIPASTLSADILAEAIVAVANDSDMRRRAESIGEAIRQEDGVEEAIRIVGRYLGVDRAGG
jgi:sterol 3beta-glucosyltransferase